VKCFPTSSLLLLRRFFGSGTSSCTSSPGIPYLLGFPLQGAYSPLLLRSIRFIISFQLLLPFLTLNIRCTGGLVPFPLTHVSPRGRSSIVPCPVCPRGLVAPCWGVYPLPVTSHSRLGRVFPNLFVVAFSYFRFSLPF